MAKQVTINELKHYFDTLPSKYKVRYYKTMLRAGGAEFAKQVRTNIRQMVSTRSASRDRDRRRLKVTKIKSGARRGQLRLSHTSLAQSITTLIRKSRKHGFIAVTGARWPEGAHAHLVERGHEIVTKDGTRTGKRTRPIPFQRRAEETSGGAVMSAMGRRLQAKLRSERV